MVGPVVTEASSQHVTELIEDARAKGATVAAGGTSEGVVHRPTVITGVTPEMRIYGEESFGPVVTVVTADGVDDAVRIANDTEYGLSAAVFGQDTDRALGVASRIESGICHVNGSTVHDEPSAPFGGVKHSGWGRFGSGQVRRRVHDAALDHRSPTRTATTRSDSTCLAANGLGDGQRASATVPSLSRPGTEVWRAPSRKQRRKCRDRRALRRLNC